MRVCAGSLPTPRLRARPFRLCVYYFVRHAVDFDEARVADLSALFRIERGLGQNDVVGVFVFENRADGCGEIREVVGAVPYELRSVPSLGEV